MKRSVHPEAYDYLVQLEGSRKIVDNMIEELVIGIWEAHADIREGKPVLGGMMVEQNDVIIENGVPTLGPDYYGYVGESYEEAMAREAVHISTKATALTGSAPEVWINLYPTLVIKKTIITLKLPQ
jgi:hypothetical protein